MSVYISKREFRTPESIAAESATRSAIMPFLESLGFQSLVDHRKSYGLTESQTIEAFSRSGEPLRIRVKLCWRLKPGSDDRPFSACQLFAKTDLLNPASGVVAFVSRLRDAKITHLLIVQPDGKEFREAALVSVGVVLAIWNAQKDESDRVAQSDSKPRRRKNHALNGSSPTLYLRDDREPSVAAVLWNHPGVIDLNRISSSQVNGHDDTFDDLVGFDRNLIGRDVTERTSRVVSGVARDQAVRFAVLERSGQSCERPGCGARRDYPGFLDVHHIFGVEASDRPWTCVALCPNCHREAHFAPERDDINLALLDYSARFKPSAAEGKAREGNDSAGE